MEFERLKKEIEEKERTRPADDIKKKIPIPDHVPVGNRLAHFIRSIHWNSKGMFPSTAGSQRTYDKYNTVTHLSFSGPDGFEIEPGEVEGGFQRKRETVQDVISTSKGQNFCRWSVPDRLLDERPAPIPDTIHEELKDEAPKKVTPPPPPSRVSRQMSLPNIPLKGSPVPRVESRVESRNGLQQTTARTPRSAEVLTPAPVQVPERSKTMFVDRKSPMLINGRKSSQNGAVDRNGLPLSALRPEAVPKAEAWMKHADKADKKVIERILKMASKKNELENNLRQTLLPDAKESVEQWLKDATEDERQVALDFFNSLAGSQLMGMTIADQRKRLKEVLNTLEAGTPTGQPLYATKPKHYRRGRQTVSDGKFRYVRLLTPHTRENRWMHTTWHHLPEYKDPKVTNWSSHYIRPHAQVPRHFVIHPDWG